MKVGHSKNKVYLAIKDKFLVALSQWKASSYSVKDHQITPRIKYYCVYMYTSPSKTENNPTTQITQSNTACREMGKQLCLNGTFTSNGSNYSSPMPAIGLYIAAATSVCFLFMLFDIWSGLRHRKPGLPCRLFSLNSLTLSLLALAAKLPVDLTTPMPSALDQLSKLTGTIMICISMGIFLPSLAAMSNSECFSNLAALTIFVVTVVVNICIQMSTGVIFSFYVEHTIILFFMLLLLLISWCCFFCTIMAGDYISDGVRGVLVKGEKSTMMQRLKLCYVYSYGKNPHMIVCRHPCIAAMGTLSTLSTMVLFEVLLRSLFFKRISFSREDSDYKWSMWVVVVSQIVTIMLGCVGNLFRWGISIQYGFDVSFSTIFDYIHLQNHLRIGFLYVLSAITMIIASPSLGFVKMVERVGIRKYGEDKEELAPNISVEKPIVRKGREDIKRWMEKTTRRKPPTHLIELLSKIRPCHQETFSNYVQRSRPTYKGRILENYRVSCLSMVILTQEAAKRPQTLEREAAKSLGFAFDEVFEIIYFIDKNTSVLNLENKERQKLAKVMWKDHWDLDNLGVHGACGPFCKPEMDVHYVRRETSAIQTLVDGYNNNLEQLFVDILCSFLVKLPQAIIKDVGEMNQLGDREGSIQHAIMYLKKLETLEDKIQWEFSSETNITNLVRDQDSGNAATAHQDTQVSAPHQAEEHEMIV